MTLIVPAVIPVSQEDLEEKLGKLAAIPEITEVQIDVVDGRYASPASWPYQGDRAAPSRLQAEGRTPQLAIVVRVEQAYGHCGRALIRSRLWDPASRALAYVRPLL